MVDWGVVCLLAATGPNSPLVGLWAATACAAVLQSLPVKSTATSEVVKRRCSGL